MKATFFVLGNRAEKYPHIIRRIHEEGHQLGIHNYKHRSNWIMMPRTILKDHVDKSALIISQITGTYPVSYRPPWGIINIFDLFLLKKYDIVFGP